MMTTWPSRETVERLRSTFPVGCRIVLDRMEDPYKRIPTGMQGTVEAVDDIGTIHCRWDCGSGLGIAYGADSAHRVATEAEAKETLEHFAKGQHSGSFCPRCGAQMQGDLYSHALSRRADIMICDKCGQVEALEDAGIIREKLPLMSWKAICDVQEGRGWKG